MQWNGERGRFGGSDRRPVAPRSREQGSEATRRLSADPARRRPLAFLLHSLFGLKLSLFTLFVCVTGTIAVVSDDLEWLYRAEVRASSLWERVSWGERYDAARVAYPDYTLDYASAGKEPYLATRFLATSAHGETRIIYVDPATGRVTGESGWITLPSFLRALHYLLFLPGDWGFFPVTALGITMMVSLVSGFFVYKKFWRGFFRLPRRSRGGRVLWGDLHRLVGLWSSWFIFVIAATSLWYMGERVLWRAGVDLETSVSSIAESDLDRLGPSPPERLPLDSLIEIAEAALPGLGVRELWFPARPDEPVFVRGQATGWLVRDRTNGVELNPYTGRVLAVHRAEAMSAIERWVHTADPLHFGDFGGLVSKLVWFVFGAAICFSVASGAVIFVKRTGKAVRACSPFPRRKWQSLIGCRFLGHWRWPNIAAVSAVPVLAYLLSWAPAVGPETLTLERALIGSWDVVVSTRSTWPPIAGEPVSWRARFCEGCYDEIRSARLSLGTHERPLAKTAELNGGANSATAVLSIDPGKQTEGLYLWLEVTDWAGERHRRGWELPLLSESGRLASGADRYRRSFLQFTNPGTLEAGIGLAK